MSGEKSLPVPDSYWVQSNLLAGEYPGALDTDQARFKLRRFLWAGITFFLDLTEEDELRPYAPLLLQEAAAQRINIEYRRVAIRDLSTPSRATMVDILTTLDQALASGHIVYVHCWGGIGRTGTVVGCYLVRQGRSGPEALAEIARQRAGTPDGWRSSPETEAQRRMVLEWTEDIDLPERPEEVDDF